MCVWAGEEEATSDLRDIPLVEIFVEGFRFLLDEIFILVPVRRNRAPGTHL